MAGVLNKQTLPVQIYRILRSDILNQEIPCGTKLTLQSLKERFGVSHTPIREALTHLVDDGLVLYYSNVGVSVVTLNAKDIRDIFRLDYEFQCIAIKMISQAGQMDALTAFLTDNVDECQRLLDAGNITGWRKQSDEFHLAFYQYADNSRLNNAAEKLRAQITLLYNLYQIEERGYRRIQNYHRAAYEALKQEDIETAVDALNRHLTEDMELMLRLYEESQTSNRESG